ncbi:MAG: aminotransferase class V-fold PLP-dependent enzyme [Oscillospiraceae bacterium]|nr:aminotransferase class V-fold PLP-dependent enzyme [Oscillospiraceae bacterium]
MKKLNFASDYTEGAHPKIIEALVSTNLYKTSGYGTDEFSEEAREKIRLACECSDAEIHFLSGGTQTNMTVIDALLRSYEGVIAAETGHISTHEAGAIEFCGHKVLTIPHTLGKINAEQIEKFMQSFLADGNREHTVFPGAVYISQPTEYGTLYSLSELQKLSEACKKYGLRLYCDGARLAYALGSKENDVTLPDLARLCDVFYIGGTKCGTLFGEAVVITEKGLIPHFFTTVKQHGALLAKGRIAGLQFNMLFTDNLYEKIGSPAVEAADRIKEALVKKGYTLFFDAPTNQIFILLDDKKYESLSEKIIMSFWEKPDESHTAVRIATSWAITEQDIKDIIDVF